jgi:hypothetical protein
MNCASQRRRRDSGDKEGRQGCEARSASTPGNEFPLFLCRVSGTGRVSIEDPVPLTRDDFKNAFTRGACASRAPLATLFVPLTRSHTLEELPAPCYVERPSPPRFLAGEKVPKADEGAFHAYVIWHQLNDNMHATLSIRLGPASVNRAYRVDAPLIRLRHLLPPQKNRGGRRTLDEAKWQGVQADCEKCRLTRHRTNGDSLLTGAAAR